MNKSLISSIAAATLVGSIGLVYAQSQGSDVYSSSSPSQTATQSMDETTTPSGPVANPNHYGASDTSTYSASTSLDTPSSSAQSSALDEEASTLEAQADRN